MAKATLESDVRLIENEELVIMGDATGESPELATARTLVRCASQHTLGEREYAEPLCNIEGALEDEIEVLFVDAAAKELTVTPDGEGRTLSGGLLVRALIKNADKEPTMYERVIEISEPIDFEYASSDVGTRVGATVTSLVTTVNAEEDGVSVVASLICEYTLYTEGNTDITVVTDGYCTDFAVDNEYGDFYYTELMDTVKLEDEIKGEIMRESCGCEKARAISCATGTLRNVSAHVDGDKLKIEGEIRFSGVACEENGEGEPTFAAFRLDLPFEKYVNLNCHYSENVRAECTVEVVRADVELDATAVYPSAALATYISLVEDKRVRRLAVSNLSGERLIPEANRVHVIFPEASDTLFEIAKRYHTTVSHVAAVNALTEECVSTSAHPSSLFGIKRLIIK
jgi:hypothetical protein